MASRLILVVLGKQGAGKGTQCKALASTYGIPHVSTGDILRAAVKAGSPLGLEVKSVLDAGALVSDDLVVKLVAERLAEGDVERGALLDGFPRTLAQAEALEKLLGPSGVSLCVNLDVSTELVTERLSSRRVCQECGAIYRASDIEAVSGTCSECSGDVVQRRDDQPEAIRQRLEAYERDTAPLLDFYDARKLLAVIDGSVEVGAVGSAIDDALSTRGLV